MANRSLALAAPIRGGFAAGTQCPSADLIPCGGNGVIDLDDLLKILAAFAGVNACA